MRWTAIFLAGVTSAGTLVTLWPVLKLGVVLEPTEAARLPVLLTTLGLLNLFLSALAAYVVLWFAFGSPLTKAEVRAVQVLARVEARRQRVAGPPGDFLANSVEYLEEMLMAERHRGERRLTDLKVSANQRERLQAELVAADRLATVGKLAAGVAHEVGNPLSGILGYLSVLRMKGDRARIDDVVDRIEAEVKRIDGIVRSLLEMGRPSRGKAQPIDAKPVVDSCVRMVRSMKEFAQVTFEVRCPEQAWVRAEAGPLAQVIVNLLLNACQACRSTVRVSLVQQTNAEISVEDDGPGIPAEVLPKLFTPFFTTKAPGQGTGLGLAVSRHLLSQFDGKLGAGNGPGGGARFTISLPVP